MALFNGTTNRITQGTAALNTTAFTITMWVKTNWEPDDSARHDLFTQRKDSANYIQFVKFSDNSYYVGGRASNTPYFLRADGAPIVTNGPYYRTKRAKLCGWKKNKWTKIHFIIDTQNGGVIKIGVDGQTSDVLTGTVVIPNLAGATRVIGNADSADTSVNFDGQIANYAVYNRALTEAELWRSRQYACHAPDDAALVEACTDFLTLSNGDFTATVGTNASNTGTTASFAPHLQLPTLAAPEKNLDKLAAVLTRSKTKKIRALWIGDSRSTAERLDEKVLNSSVFPLAGIFISARTDNQGMGSGAFGFQLAGVTNRSHKLSPPKDTFVNGTKVNDFPVPLFSVYNSGTVTIPGYVYKCGQTAGGSMIANASGDGGGFHSSPWLDPTARRPVSVTFYMVNSSYAYADRPSFTFGAGGNADGVGSLAGTVPNGSTGYNEITAYTLVNDFGSALVPPGQIYAQVVDHPSAAMTVGLGHVCAGCRIDFSTTGIIWCPIAQGGLRNTHHLSADLAGNNDAVAGYSGDGTGAYTDRDAIEFVSKVYSDADEVLLVQELGQNNADSGSGASFDESGLASGDYSVFKKNAGLVTDRWVGIIQAALPGKRITIAYVSPHATGNGNEVRYHWMATAYSELAGERACAFVNMHERCRANGDFSGPAGDIDPAWWRATNDPIHLSAQGNRRWMALFMQAVQDGQAALISSIQSSRSSRMNARLREGPRVLAGSTNATVQSITDGAIIKPAAGQTLQQAIEGLGTGVRYVPYLAIQGERPLKVAIGCIAGEGPIDNSTAPANVYFVKPVEGGGVSLELAGSVTATFNASSPNQTVDTPSGSIAAKIAGGVSATASARFTSLGGTVNVPLGAPQKAEFTLLERYSGLVIAGSAGTTTVTAAWSVQGLWEE